ncbi:protein translocase subunit [Phlyctochytrium planicorne]|nr:protein translocase subunit [Phlyctochytrium planicorne]
MSTSTLRQPGHQLPSHFSQNPQLRSTSIRSNSTNFFSEFAKSVKRQVEENKEFQTNLKQLSEKGTELSESDAMKSAREAMSKSAAGTSKVVSAVASGVGKGVETVLESAPAKVIGHAAVKVGETVQKAAEPILETKTAKTIASGIHTIQKDLSSSTFSSQYAEFKPKEVRDRERAERLAEEARNPNRRIVAPNAEATAVVVTKPSKWQELMKNNPLAIGVGNFKRQFEESENPMVEWVRDVWYRASSVMDETEEAKCIKAIKTVDPAFDRHRFLSDCATWIVPEVLEAHLKGDLATIQTWCSEKVIAELSASLELQRQSGLVSDCKLLDIDGVDIKLLFIDEEIPAVVLSFRTQEILLFRDRKTGEIKLGNEDHIDRASYAIVMAKEQLVDPNRGYNAKTNGWRIMQWAASRRGF